MISTSALFLVYVSQTGQTVLQPWQDTDVVGTPIDPASDVNMELVGWTLEQPGSEAVCARCGDPVIEDPEYGGYVYARAEDEPCRDDRGHYADPYG